MHDWTLVSVTVDWMNGNAELSFKTAAGPAVVVAHDREIEMLRHHPWGPSVSVNKANLH